MEAKIILEMKGISKEFPGVQALENVDFELRESEVHALVGENGAGKSTLMLVLGGVYTDYQGQIFLAGRELKFSNPREAIAQGIGIIYQELDLVPELTVGENIVLGNEPTSRKLKILRLINRRTIYQETEGIIEELGFDLSPKVKVSALSVADQQLVQIAKAIKLSAKVLVMDEPTARLDYYETEKLFEYIKLLKRKGISIIYISHHLEEIFEIADRVTVLRDGRMLGTRETKSTSLGQITFMMVGRNLNEIFTREEIPKGEELLLVRGLSRSGAFEDINLWVREGEILGIAGVVGSGRTEVARCIFGADKLDNGEIYIHGKPAKIDSTKTAVKRGIGMVSENRKEEGLILNHTVGMNITLAVLRWISMLAFVNFGKRNALANDMIHSLRIKTAGIDQEVQLLSGGNQQKVAIAKWLCTKSRILILDQPTRGIDVGAKQEVYRLIVDLSKQGTAIILISDELPELIGLADRIVVMRKGRITQELRRNEFSEAKLLASVLGVDTKDS